MQRICDTFAALKLVPAPPPAQSKLSLAPSDLHASGESKAAAGDQKSDSEELHSFSGAGERKKESVGLQDFEILHVLGEGNFGKVQTRFAVVTGFRLVIRRVHAGECFQFLMQVMHVRKTDTRKEYAMKMLRSQALRKEDRYAEQKILSMLDHPFLVSLSFH